MTPDGRAELLYQARRFIRTWFYGLAVPAVLAMTAAWDRVRGGLPWTGQPRQH